MGENDHHARDEHAIRIDLETRRFIEAGGKPHIAKALVENAARSKIGEPQKADWRSGIITASDLRGKDFKPVRFIVQGLFAEGLNLLASKPKVGKSWAALDIALAVAGGGTVFGDSNPARGDVLGLFLEDNERRLKNRIAKLLTADDPWPDTLSLKTEWRRIDEGGLDDLEDWCNEVDNPTLIIIDTLARVRPASKSKASAYEQDTAALAGLHKLALEYRVCILVLHHQRKMESDDPFDTISGTLGLTGVADVLSILKRGTNGVVLHVTGRDVEQNEIAVSFNRETCRWEVLGAASEVYRSEQQKKIIEVLSAEKEPMSLKEICIAADLPEKATQKTLSRMAKDGVIERRGRGRYAMPCLIGLNVRKSNSDTTDISDNTDTPDRIDTSGRPPWKRNGAGKRRSGK